MLMIHRHQIYVAKCIFRSWNSPVQTCAKTFRKYVHQMQVWRIQSIAQDKQIYEHVYKYFERRIFPCFCDSVFQLTIGTQSGSPVNSKSNSECQLSCMPNWNFSKFCPSCNVTVLGSFQTINVLWINSWIDTMQRSLLNKLGWWNFICQMCIYMFACMNVVNKCKFESWWT